ncbi:ABC transporter substrate-binding protein [Paenibacillus allorhizosphaerae]|nr:ABC transporter substrate-binding protein [Paenibacillus allorhizosphaerae]
MEGTGRMKRGITIATLFVLLAGATLTGCREPAERTSEQPVPEKDATTGSAPAATPPVITEKGLKQSPLLDGKGLPDIAERLPKEPKLTNEMPPELLTYQIGSYGGTLRTARTDVNTDNTVFIIENEPLVNTPGLLGSEVTGNVLKSYQVSDDQKQFTFRMREGLKWSDGQPVTTEDVKFAVEDVLLSEELTPGGLPPWLKSAADSAGAPMAFEVIDDYTFKISFDKPYGGFLMQLAVQGWRGYNDLLKPKHYLKQFHAKYTPPEKLEPLIKEAGFPSGDWAKLFNLKDIINTEITHPQAVGFPVLSPYMQVKAGDTIEFERNPYYFKVDAAGQQLPYIDKLRSSLVQNVEMVILKIMSGEIDHSYEYVTIPKLPLLKEQEKKGGYTLYLTKLHRTANDIHLNLTYKDPAWRKVVQDVRFRKALNLALNKKEIVDSVFFGMAKPSPIQDTTFDLKEANRILDDMGMTKGADGFRVGPDGKKFAIPFEISSSNQDFIKLGQVVTEQWRLLGLDVTMKQIDSALWDTRNKANELMATVMFTPGPVQWSRQEWGQNIWAPLWDRWWNTGGKEGEEPPPEAKAYLQSIFELREVSLQQAEKKRDEIRANLGWNLWYFVHAEDVVLPVAVNSRIGNFSDKGWGIAYNFAGEQWFFKK